MRLEGVWVAYSGSGRPAIVDVSLSVPLGVMVLVTGPNGAGKTTLLETCLGLLKPVRGRALLLGVDTRSRGIVEARRRCSYVPQDFMRAPHESYTARRVIELGLALSPLGAKAAAERVEWAAKLLGIEDLLDRPIGTLSGGEQQKVYIARAMARRPDVLFLDEPFSSLDRESRAAVAKAIREYVNERGATALVVSHDVSPVLSLVDTIVRMSGGKIVEVGRRA